MGDPGRRHRSPARRPGATQLYLRRLAAGEARNLPAPRRGQAQTTTAKDISRRNLILTHMGQSPPGGFQGSALTFLRFTRLPWTGDVIALAARDTRAAPSRGFLVVKRP